MKTAGREAAVSGCTRRGPKKPYSIAQFFFRALKTPTVSPRFVRSSVRAALAGRRGSADGDRRGLQLGGAELGRGRIAQGRLDAAEKPDRQTSPTRPCGEGTLPSVNVQGRQERVAVVRHAPEHRVRKPCSGARLGAHELNALAHRDLATLPQVDELERGEAQRRAHARGNFSRFGEMGVECLVQAPLGGRRAQNEPAGKGSIAPVERAEGL